MSKEIDMTNAISTSYFSTIQNYLYNNTSTQTKSSEVTSRVTTDTQDVSSKAITSRQVTWAASIAKRLGCSDSTVKTIDDTAIICSNTGSIVKKAAEVCGKTLSTPKKMAVMGAVAGLQFALHNVSSTDSQDVMKNVTSAASSLTDVAQGLIGLTAMTSGTATGILPAVVAASTLAYGLWSFAELYSAA